eukprot:TRINITY_DN12_c0_g2_i1.p1 TRINITY_DN12_c0_g2~~TRINITY_DN12_c0_g2_i1.p1  ORF type:complete len:1381 (-),score=162.30 TRINITY_DN12_c0_g2_i1:17440-21582(-)
MVKCLICAQGSEPDTFFLNGKCYKIKLVPEEEAKSNLENVSGRQQNILSVSASILDISLKGNAVKASQNLLIEPSVMGLNIDPSISRPVKLSDPFFSEYNYADLTSSPEPEKIEPERQLHLAFLFAGPLVTAYKDEGQIKIKSMPPLEYHKEIDQIVENAGESCQGIKYKKCVATLDNFQQCMNDMPLALHFAGHGIKNTAFGAERIHDGDFLVFEDEYGKAQYVSCQILKGILRACPRQPEFVFVSSCHSRLVGDVFKSAGAKHVICVKRSEKVLDEVAILFAQEFYKAFFMPHGTVCTAFEVAKTKVMTKTAEHVDHTPFLAQGTEYMKFELLIGGDYSTMPHSCSNPHPVPIGKPMTIIPSIEYKDIPSKVEHFVGRKCELYNIISLIRDSRIVTIKGLPGIGKTSIAKTLAHFFLERGTFRDGIIYISARGVESTDALVTQLYIASKSSTDTVKDKLAQIVNALQDKNVLLIVDNAEDPVNKDKAQFLNTTHALLSQLPSLKILITSRTHLGSLPDLTEKVYNLLPLDSKSAILLLEKRAPRQISSSEVDELLHEEDTAPINTGNSLDDLKCKFGEHKLMQLLAGHPQAISLAAALLQGRTLKEIYQELMSSSLRANEMHSLKISLALSIEHVKTRNADSVKFFKVMGLFPCGACSEEMETIWGAGYKEHVNNLQYVSLLVRKESGDLQEDRYWLLPFMADYALNYLKDYDITDVFQKGCEYYAGKLEAIFMTDCNLNGALIKDEPNIVAFLGYGSGKYTGESSEDDKSELGEPGPKEKQACELVIESNGKELVPSREAVELLGTEESKLAGTLCNRTRQSFTQGLRRRNSERFEELSLPPLERQHSENSCNLSSSVVQSQRQRKMSLFGVEEEKQLYVNNNTSGNDSADQNVTTDEELSLVKKRSNPSAVPKPKIVMTIYGKLLVYYCANLLMFHRYNDANRTILNYINAPNLNNDTLAKGNLYKLLGLVCDKLQELEKQKDYTVSKNYYCTAKQLFFKSDSYLGQAACLVALGEIERQQGEYEKAKWSYENALRNYALIKHSYGVALSHGALALIKDKLSLKKQSKEHVIQAKLVKDTQTGPGGSQKNYIGGKFVSRWEGGPSAFIVEIAKVASGMFEEYNAIEMVTDNKKKLNTIIKRNSVIKAPKRREITESKRRALNTRSPERIEDGLPFTIKQENVKTKRWAYKVQQHNANMTNSGIFSIEEEESKELPSELSEKLEIRNRKKTFALKKGRNACESNLKVRAKGKEESTNSRKVISKTNSKAIKQQISMIPSVKRKTSKPQNELALKPTKSRNDEVEDSRKSSKIPKALKNKLSNPQQLSCTIYLYLTEVISVGNVDYFLVNNIRLSTSPLSSKNGRQVQTTCIQDTYRL